MGTHVVCAGTFDHIHPGHTDFLKQAKALGDKLTVIIARDENVKRIKKRTSDSNELKRKAGIEKTGIADNVILGSVGKDILSILNDLKPDIVAIGYDQRVSEDSIKKQLPSSKVVRLKPFHPERYKSSYFRTNSQSKQ
jgi:FAD synthetase